MVETPQTSAHIETRKRRWTAARWLRLLVTAVVGAYAAVILIGNPVTTTVFTNQAAEIGFADFGSFYASGQAAAQGLDPYDVYPLTLDAALGRGTGAAVNLNAPVSVLLFQAMASVDVVTARRLWFVATFAAYLATVVLIAREWSGLRSGLALAWAFAIAALFETVVLGQVYAFLALIATCVWVLLLRHRALVAGGLMGFLAAFKPNFVVWPIVLFCAGHRRAGAAGLVATALWDLVPLGVYGPSVYERWVSAVRLEPINTQVANAALPGMLVRQGLPVTMAVGVAAAGLLALAVWVWRRKTSVATTTGLAVPGLLLCSPIAWVGYSLFLLPNVARARPGIALVIAAALLCIPRLVLQGWAERSVLLGVTVGSAYTVAWVILLGYELRRS